MRVQHTYNINELFESGRWDELEAELLESIAEADRGETMTADALLSRLRRRS